MKPGDYVREYELLEKIGAGGMGEVWKAVHVHLERQVAIKVLFEKFLGDASFKSRFIKEAKAMCRLQHPYILGVLDFFVEGGGYYLILPYIAGSSLEIRLRDKAHPLGREETLAIAEKLLDALAYAHEQGVVHRDVKPANILLDARGNPYLHDFGIAIVSGEERLTVVGSSIGTPHYMSPEQIRMPEAVDRQTDQYSFACVLYEMLCGRPPFVDDSNSAVMVAHCTVAAPPMSAIDPTIHGAVDEVVLRSLAKDPAERFPDCRAFLKALQRAWRTATVRAKTPAAVPPPEAPPEPPPEPLRARPTTEPELALPEGIGQVASPDDQAVPEVFTPPTGLRRQELVIACLQRIAIHRNLPVLSKNVHDLMVATSNRDNSLRSLANIILNNVGLTAKVLRLVNSLYYNRSTTPIVSITHAVVLMGWEAVRNLTASVVLVESFNLKLPGVRELMALSVLAGSHAKGVSQQIGFRQKEVAYLCGMLSYLGELMIACYQPQSYAAVQQLRQEKRLPERQAVLKVLGFSYDDLGHEVLRRWNIPEKLGAGMTEIEHTPARITDDTDALQVIGAFSRELSSAFYRSSSQEEGNAKVKALLARIGNVLDLNEEQLGFILKDAVSEARETFRAARIPMEGTQLAGFLLKQLGVDQKKEVRRAEERLPTQRPATESFMQLAKDLVQIFETEARLDINDVILMILETIFRGLSLDHVLFCLLSKDEQFLQARTGLGADTEALIQRFKFSLTTESGPVRSVMLLQKEMFVEDRTLVPGYQGEFFDVVKDRAFAMIPIVMKKRAIGCFFLGRLELPLSLGIPHKRLLLKLRDMLADQLAKRGSQ